MKPRRTSSIRKTDSLVDASSIYSGDESEEETENSSEQNEDVEEEYPVKWTRLLKMNSEEWLYILIGCVAAIIVGGSFPVFAILFGEVYGVRNPTQRN